MDQCISTNVLEHRILLFTCICSARLITNINYGQIFITYSGTSILIHVHIQHYWTNRLHLLYVFYFYSYFLSYYKSQNIEGIIMLLSISILLLLCSF